MFGRKKRKAEPVAAEPDRAPAVPDPAYEGPAWIPDTTTAAPPSTTESRVASAEQLDAQPGAQSGAIAAAPAEKPTAENGDSGTAPHPPSPTLGALVSPANPLDEAPHLPGTPGAPSGGAQSAGEPSFADRHGVTSHDAVAVDSALERPIEGDATRGGAVTAIGLDGATASADALRVSRETSIHDEAIAADGIRGSVEGDLEDLHRGDGPLVVGSASVETGAPATGDGESSTEGFAVSRETANGHADQEGPVVSRETVVRPLGDESYAVSRETARGPAGEASPSAAQPLGSHEHAATSGPRIFSEAPTERSALDATLPVGGQHGTAGSPADALTVPGEGGSLHTLDPRAAVPEGPADGGESHGHPDTMSAVPDDEPILGEQGDPAPSGSTLVESDLRADGEGEDGADARLDDRSAHDEDDEPHVNHHQPAASPATPPPLSVDPEEHRRAALVSSLPQADEETPLMAELQLDARRRIELRGRRFPRPAETRIITVANQKGGVGKTTTTVNLAAALAQAGLNVLVLDNDPQGNASTALGIDHRAGTPSIYEVLVEGAPIEEAVQESPDVPNLWCLPATIDLSGAEIELVSMVARETRLRNALDRYLQWRVTSGLEPIDYVFVDCPPSLGLLTVNAFVVAREVLIPIQCEYYALEGLSQLLKSIQLIQAHLNPDLHVSTILLTMYDARTNLAQQVADEVRTHFPERTLRTTVPRSVRISEAPSYGQTVMTYDAGSSGALAYLEAAREIAERGADPAGHADEAAGAAGEDSTGAGQDAPVSGAIGDRADDHRRAGGGAGAAPASTADASVVGAHQSAGNGHIHGEPVMAAPQEDQ